MLPYRAPRLDHGRDFAVQPLQDGSLICARHDILVPGIDLEADRDTKDQDQKLERDGRPVLGSKLTDEAG